LIVNASRPTDHASPAARKWLRVIIDENDEAEAKEKKEPGAGG
jgi:hypothetical protein